MGTVLSALAGGRLGSWHTRLVIAKQMSAEYWTEPPNAGYVLTRNSPSGWLWFDA